MHIHINQANKILSLIDLTSLSGNETDDDIKDLCLQACCGKHSVAAVCIYPQHIELAKKSLANKSKNPVRIATVVNFPTGEDALPKIVHDISTAITAGANEVDVVLPYRRFLAGDIDYCRNILMRSREACAKNVTLKVIIETGELKSPERIKQASELAIECGADFIKTSTGKVPVNATLEAADIILHAIKSCGRTDIGFKASGGIKTVQDATEYILLCEEIMSAEWVTPERFRFGASGLLNSVNQVLSATTSQIGDY